MAAHKVICWDCGCDVEDPFVNTCPKCGGLLTVKMDLEPLKGMKPEDLHKEPIGVWRYAPFLPVDYDKRISIKEGGTPLYKTDLMAACIPLAMKFCICVMSLVERVIRLDAENLLMSWTENS